MNTKKHNLIVDLEWKQNIALVHLAQSIVEFEASESKIKISRGFRSNYERKFKIEKKKRKFLSQQQQNSDAI